MSVSTQLMVEPKKPIALPAFFLKRGAAKLVIGGGIVALIVLVVVLSPWIAPYDPVAQSLRERLRPPVFAGGDIRHVLGTDELGRDILSRLMSGGRISLAIAALAVVGSTVLGTFLGLISAYYGGKLDAVLTAVAEIQLAIPSILIIIIFLAVIGPSIITLGLILALSDWVSYARTMRARAMVEQAREYITAARAIGARDMQIIMRHLWPNVLPTLLVLATLSVGGVILTESALSFLGLGVQRPFPSWGRMVSDGQAYLTQAWWISGMPAAVIALTVFGLNLVGDGLRQLWKME